MRISCLSLFVLQDINTFLLVPDYSPVHTFQPILRESHLQLINIDSSWAAAS